MKCIKQKKTHGVILPEYVIFPFVNFTNILHATFSYENFAGSYLVLTFWVCTFLPKILGQKLLLECW